MIDVKRFNSMWWQHIRTPFTDAGFTQCNAQSAPIYNPWPMLPWCGVAFVSA